MSSFDLSETSTKPPARTLSGSATESSAPLLDRARLTVLVRGSVVDSRTVDRDTVIGRGDEVDLKITGSQVSREHARIKRVPLGFMIEDLGSRNGTVVNGLPIRQRLLAIGDRIQIGEATLLFTPPDHAEEQLMELQRMEAMGRLVAGVAHDFNNLLGAIIGNLDFVGRLPDEQSLGSPEVREGLADAEAAAQRAADIVTQLLSFARSDQYQRRPTDIGPLVHEVSRLVRRTFDPTIEIRTEAESGLVANVDPSQLHQVLMNLCLNARDAMPDGGRLIIRLRRANPVDAAMLVGLHAPALELSVADDGVGMDAATRERVFEPFFTSKSLGRGMGLGLATVYGIVRNHGGSITVDSEPGAGSVFKVFLAVTDVSTSPRTRALRDMKTEDIKYVRRVLVVDDDDLVRRSLGRLLRQLGHEVSSASSGEDALEIYAQGNVDLVLLDLIMPGLSGEATYRRLRELDPAAKVLFVSGYYDHAKVKREAAAGHCRVLQKPCDSISLRGAIADLLSDDQDRAAPDEAE